ncbi:hypothetical protein Zmor_026967 [Zophobas morio]|uniref:Uncharacterized protein n=1 Tax=Zophobas morio TaxID=2755281 RepID=A0AA38M5K4_9CUCU|nr:hypothetical protein Zmor_026967 [Zophobas morio]
MEDQRYFTVGKTRLQDCIQALQDPPNLRRAHPNLSSPTKSKNNVRVGSQLVFDPSGSAQPADRRHLHGALQDNLLPARSTDKSLI